MGDTPWDEFPDSGFLRDTQGEPLGRLEHRSDGTDWITQYPTPSGSVATTLTRT